MEKPTVAGVVGEIVKRAEANDVEFFAMYLDPSYKGQEPKLIQMIKASGMPSNYPARLRHVSDASVRLDYHYLEEGCHFQVDLERKDGVWTIKRIWFCR